MVAGVTAVAGLAMLLSTYVWPPDIPVQGAYRVSYADLLVPPGVDPRDVAARCAPDAGVYNLYAHHKRECLEGNPGVVFKIDNDCSSLCRKPEDMPPDPTPLLVQVVTGDLDDGATDHGALATVSACRRNGISLAGLAEEKRACLKRPTETVFRVDSECIGRCEAPFYGPCRHEPSDRTKCRDMGGTWAGYIHHCNPDCRNIPWDADVPMK